MSKNENLGPLGDEVVTTDDAWTVALNWGVPDPASAMTGTVYLVCRNPSTGDAAFWEQPVGVKSDGTNAGLADALPAQLVSQKDQALHHVDMRISFSGKNMRIEVKGLASTSLHWLGKIFMPIWLGD